MVASLYQPLLSDPDFGSRVALTTHELLENALKYSVDGTTLIRVELSRNAQNGKHDVRVETRNAVSADRKAGLEDVFTEMSKAESADVYYQFAMRRTRTMRHGSGLGLARIWSEGEAELSHSYEGDVVRITAVTRGGAGSDE